MIASISLFFVNLSGIMILPIQDSETNNAGKDLGPILEPAPIKFSFDTPGWYFLGFLILLILLFTTVRWIKQYRANVYRREAIKSLDQLSLNSSDHGSGSQLIDLLIILKRVALQTYGRKEVAALYGKPWLLFLESKARNTSFSKFQLIIAKATYEDIPIDIKDLNELKNLSKKWIRNHA